MPVALTPKRPGTFTEIKYFDVKLTEGTDYTTHFENDTNRTYKKKKVKFIGQDTATVTIIPKIAADLFGPDNTTADLQDGNAVGANPNDIFQSQLPDCAPMAVFASLAKNPAKLKALFTILPDGNVKIRFYPLGGGAPVDITVPMTLDFGADTPRLSGDTNAAGGIEIWPQILHTAYRQFLTQTGQPDIGTGRSPSDTLFHLTGIQSSTSSLLKDLTVEQIQQQITDGLAANKPIYLVTPTQQPGDPPITFGIFIIYYWHTFTVIGLNADGKAIIYNPHGGGTAAQAIMSFAEIKTTFMSNTSLTVAQSAF